MELKHGLKQHTLEADVKGEQLQVQVVEVLLTIRETCRDKSVLLLKRGIESYAEMLFLLPYSHFTPPSHSPLIVPSITYMAFA